MACRRLLVIDGTPVEYHIGYTDDVENVIVPKFEDALNKNNRNAMMYAAQMHNDHYSANLLQQCSMYLS